MKKPLSREKMLTAYAYHIAASGTTGDAGDMMYVMNDDGIEATEEDAEFVSNKIHDIYNELQKRGEGKWQGLVTRGRILSWIAVKGDE